MIELVGLGGTSQNDLVVAGLELQNELTRPVHGLDLVNEIHVTAFFRRADVVS